MLAGEDWSEERPAKGGTAIELGPGASHVHLSGLRINGYAFAVLAKPVAGGAGRNGIAIDDVDVSRARYGIYLSDCDDVSLTGCDLRRYTKHGFRLDQGCDRVAFTRCTADCSEGDVRWETKTELLPFGFNVNSAGAANTAITFTDCLAANHLMPLQKNRYKNGDGFVIEENARDVAFVRCRALRNQDGGFDLKVPAVRLTGCVAIDNSRAFRIWNGGQLDNCLAAFGNTGIWSNGAAIAVTRSTFHQLGNAAAMTDDRARGTVTLSDCLVTASARLAKNTAAGNVVATETPVLRDAPAAGYPTAAITWDGLGDAMDSLVHPDKGYLSTR